MGSWGQGIYDSDSSLDFLSRFTDILLKEAAYWFSPEQVYTNAWWVTSALMPLDVMLIFVDDALSTVFLSDQHRALRRWQEVFFGVWDAEWDDTSNINLPYSTHSSRVEHREIVQSVFERLIKIADAWREDLPKHNLPPFAIQEKLPLFSNGAHGIAGRFLDDFLDMLRHTLVFMLSEEKRETEWGIQFYDLDEIRVCIDLIRMLCEAYHLSPNLRPATIQRWLDTTIGLWLKLESEEEGEPVDVETLARQGDLYANTVTTFVRLIGVAQQYPRGWTDL